MINVGDYKVHHGSALPWLYAFQLDVLQVNVFHDPVFHDPL
jgi:hypothetical protein